MNRGARRRRDPHSLVPGLGTFYYEGRVVELTLVICTANFTNRLNDALEMTLDLGV